MSIRILKHELLKITENGLNESAETRQKQLKEFQYYITLQSDLNIRDDEQWLLSFLRGCKFDLEKSKKKISMFYSMRSSLPEFFDNRDPFLPEIQEVLRLGLFLPLPKTVDPGGPRIVLIRCKNVDPSKILFVTVLKTSIMIIDILLNEDDNFIIAGQRGLLDLEDMTFRHALQVTPNIIRKLLTLLYDSYPTRPQGFHFINMPMIAKVVYRLVKPLLRLKLLKRVHFHPNNEELLEQIPSSVLPKEYGGDEYSVDTVTAYWKEKVESYKDWFMEDAQYGVLEKTTEVKPEAPID